MLNPQIMIQKNVPIIKRWAGDTPSETAFFRWSLAGQFRAAGFRNVVVQPFDFLHPWLPDAWTGCMDSVGHTLEKTVLLREIAGSVYVHAEK